MKMLSEGEFDKLEYGRSPATDVIGDARRNSEAMARRLCPPLFLSDVPIERVNIRPGDVTWLGDPPPPCVKRDRGFFEKWHHRLSNAWAALRGEFPYED
jgi:hypothetical protein